MSRLRVIIVGLGARSRLWRRVLDASPDCVIVGLVDTDAEVLESARRACPDAATGCTLAAVTQRVDADAVLLVTPPARRTSQIADACAARLAILAEKPLAATISEAEAHVASCEAAGVTLMVGLNFRYLAVTRALRSLLDSRQVGAPEFARFTYERWRDGKQPQLNKYPLQMDQPMLWEQSIHHFDLMRYVYAAEPTGIYARTFNPSWSMYARDANVSALIEFDDGLQLNYQGTWAGNWQQPGFCWRTECGEGIVVQRDMFGDLAYARRDDPDLTDVPLPPYEIWYDDAVTLLERFVATVRDGDVLECSGRDHLQSLRMVQACVLSSATGNRVDPRTLPARPAVAC